MIDKRKQSPDDLFAPNTGPEVKGRALRKATDGAIVLARSLWASDLPIYCGIALVAWIGNYLYCHRFGLYEDDWSFIGRTVNWSFHDYCSNVTRLLMSMEAESAARLYSRLGLGEGHDRSGRLSAHLPRRVSDLSYQLSSSVPAGNNPCVRASRPALRLCFALFPADTTHAYLHVLFVLHLSIAFWLLACNLYLSGREKTAYGLIFASLLTYETCFLPFCAIPLLQREWDRRLLVKLGKHLTILLVMFATFAGTRYWMNEVRLVDACQGHESALAQVIQLMTTGPIVSLKMFALRPSFAWSHLADPQYFSSAGLSFPAVLVGVALIFLVTLVTLRIKLPGWRRSTAGKGGNGLRVGGHPDYHREKPEWVPVGKALLVGSVMLVLSYPIAIGRDPTCIAGRLSTIHSAASVGESLVVGALLSLVYSLFAAIHCGMLFAAAAGCYFAHAWGVRLDGAARLCKKLAGATERLEQHCGSMPGCDGWNGYSLHPANQSTVCSDHLVGRPHYSSIAMYVPGGLEAASDSIFQGGHRNLH